MTVTDRLRALLDRAPATSIRTQRLSVACLQAGLALMAFVSLYPYFMWGYQKPFYAIATLTVIASCAGCFRTLSFTREHIFLSLLFSLFLIYLSLLPKVHGGTTRWYFLIPFTVALIHIPWSGLRGTFEKFYWIFALSLLPGMLVWCWAVAGLPLEMHYATPPSEIVHRGTTEYVELPGVVFLMANMLVLPHGGVLFRLCGMLDEPGTVGTIAALCLAVTRYRINDFRGVIVFVAGIMSFSIAFAVLTTLGMIMTALNTKRPWLLPVALLSAVIGATPLIGLRSADATSNITILMPAGPPSPPAPASEPAPKTAPPKVSAEQPVPAKEEQSAETRERFAPIPQWSLRNATEFDNRATPWMKELFADYRNSPLTSLLFGIASDASIIHGWGSAVWYRVLTDFGIVGFVWVFVLFAAPLWHLWRTGGLRASSMIFCVLFLMSFYQRPIIWLPAQLLIYLSGIYWLCTPRDRTSPGYVAS